jgi:superoxide reductase
MYRRDFVRGSIAAGLTLAAGTAHAQRARCPACPPARADWSATGAFDGRAAANPAALTDDERVHVPVLSIPERVRAGRAFDLVVQIGVRPHEMTADHHVDWIEVAIDDARVFVTDLSAAVAYPIVRVPIAMRASGALVARARCSQHGVWLTRRDVLVT